MTIEAMWYAAYLNGRPPKCNRLTRIPYHEQLGMAFELALDFPAGWAGYRAVGKNTVTGETYWWWPRDNVKHGDWWMLPERTVKLMEFVTKYAKRRAEEDRMPRRDWWLPPSARWSPDLTLDDKVRVELRRLLRRAKKAARVFDGQEPPPFKRPNLANRLVRPKDTPWHLIRIRQIRGELMEHRYDKVGPSPMFIHWENSARDGPLYRKFGL